MPDSDAARFVLARRLYGIPGTSLDYTTDYAGNQGILGGGKYAEGHARR